MRTLALGAAALLLGVPVARVVAQDGVMLSAGYLLAGEPDESTWRLTIQRALLGPIGVDLSGSVLPGTRPGQVTSSASG